MKLLFKLNIYTIFLIRNTYLCLLKPFNTHTMSMDIENVINVYNIYILSTYHLNVFFLFYELRAH